MINPETLFVPSEIIENVIIPNSAVPWLRVSKKYHQLAIKYIVNENVLLEDPQWTMSSATYHKNYALLDVLLADRRYTESRILSHTIQMCSTDRKANMIYLKHCFGNSWIKQRVLAAAVRNDWIEVVEYAFNHKDTTPISLDLNYMPETIFELVIHHPKLKWNDKCITYVSINKNIPDSTKLKVLTVSDINLELVIENFTNETFLDVLSEDLRVINSAQLQHHLWSKIIASNAGKDGGKDKLKKILEKRQLDPALDYNLPLRLVLMERYFTEETKTIAQMILDDDRVTLTLEPFDKNLIVTALSYSLKSNSIKQVKFILSHPKFKKEWLESTMRYLLVDQLNDATHDTIFIIFTEHEFDDYLSEEICAMYPRAKRRIARLELELDAYFNGYTHLLPPESDNDKVNPIEKYCKNAFE